ncbi:MAG: DUF503 domain-containing protein [Thermotogaceae bacterium]|nr:DUF503 domain-containing protein [Mesotoga sp.]NLX33315.1 DUF503 domain-containing protein [Thermotogaceae bacterium]HOY25994.1 DUF503 domain-containing protein [Mesotoga sp.]HPX21751.1 DUF503 domain-containing protein [Mesotoga sp.]HQC55790.1 DUF503 domain-containing protein [Mesotoga sp.]
MHFGYMTYLVKLEGINSLKEKRGVIRPVFNDLKKNFNASIVETGRHDSREEFEVTIGIVANTRGELDSLFNSVYERILWNGFEVIGESGESW